MLSSILVAAFAASALAVPFKRDVVTDIDWVVVTDVVTVYATAPTGIVQANHAYGGPPGTWEHSWDHTWDHTWIGAPSATDAPTSSSVAEVAPTSASSTWVAPAPTTPISVYVAPTPSSTSVYVAPPPPSSTSTWVAPAAPTPTSVYVAPAPSSTWVASTSVSAASSAPTGYAETAVWHHNVHRANQTDTGTVTWNDTLAAAAQQIAESCTFAHKMGVNGLSYGQNIAAGAQDVGVVVSNLWYNGEVNAFAPYYNEANPGGDFDSYGHFTQVVWKGTDSVGCATVQCAGQGSWADGNWADVPSYYTVCNYGPAGNVDGEYAENIGASLNLATVSGSS